MLLLGLLANADMPTTLADYADPYPDADTHADTLTNPDPDIYTNTYPDVSTDLDYD